MTGAEKQQDQFMDDNNFNIWELQVKVILIANELYDIATGVKVYFVM